MEINIKTDLFRAVMFFMAINDKRYYLNGIYLETGSEGARLVATDGRAMAIAKVDKKVHPESRVIIPDQLCQAARKLAKVKEITFRYNEGFFDFSSVAGAPDPLRTIELIYGPDLMHQLEVGGVYPDYRRVIPTSLSGEASHIDPQLLVLIAKAGQELGGRSARYPGVIQNGKENCLSVIGDDLFVLVMPMPGAPVEPVKPPVWGKMPIHKAAPAETQSKPTLEVQPTPDPQAALTF
jgi:DNA polymerase III beta subunit, central domain